MKENKLNDTRLFINSNVFINTNNNKYYTLINSDGNDINNYLFQLNNLTNNNILICKNFYNYEQTECIKAIPDGFYCNDTDKKTIDKCHINCEKCIQGPTDNNNNCLKCKNELYIDLVNCVSDCINGVLINNIYKCKCTYDKKCEICSKESELVGQCISCNIDEGFYPKSDYNNTTLSFINCYNNETISDGYYLNKSLNLYEPCYNTCSKCSNFGDENNNNCDECKSGYSFINNYTNDKNCYRQCNYYYYIDF